MTDIRRSACLTSSTEPSPITRRQASYSRAMAVRRFPGGKWTMRTNVAFRWACAATSASRGWRGRARKGGGAAEER